MSNGGLINLGELSKPATVLIERIAEAVGGYFRPFQIRRLAEAEADAAKIKAVAQIEITELHRRAFERFIGEEAQKQKNIEEVTKRALPEVNDSAFPEKVEQDWLTNFFEKCRVISDRDMQSLWARILAGEANSPGRYSKRTVNFLSSLDRSDAEMFNTLCSFAWRVGTIVPLIFDHNDEIYRTHGLTFHQIKHLDDIGLLSYKDWGGFGLSLKTAQGLLVANYHDQQFAVIPRKEAHELQIGHVMLSKVGEELATICDFKPVPGFGQYVIQKWNSLGFDVTPVKFTADGGVMQQTADQSG